MKIIAGVHPADSGTMRVDGKEVAFPFHPRRACRRHRHGASGAQRRPGTERRRKCVLRHPAGQRNGRRRLATDGRERRRGIEEPRPRHRSARAARRFSDRRAAAGRAVSRAVFRRAHHHPRRADLCAVAAGDRTAVRRPRASCATKAAASIFISHFLDDILTISDDVTVFRNGRKVATAEVTPAIDKGWIIERMIGRAARNWRRATSARSSLRAAPRPRSCCRRRISRSRLLSQLTFDARAGEVLGIYGFMGCGQLELGAHTLRQARPESGSLAIDGKV